MRPKVKCSTGRSPCPWANPPSLPTPQQQAANSQPSRITGTDPNAAQNAPGNPVQTFAMQAKKVWPEGKKFCDTVCEYLGDMVKIQVHLPATLTNSSAVSLGTSVFSSSGQGARQEHPGDFPCAKGCSGKCQMQREGGSEDPERAVESRDR